MRSASMVSHDTDDQQPHPAEQRQHALPASRFSGSSSKPGGVIVTAATLKRVEQLRWVFGTALLGRSLVQAAAAV